MKSIGQVLKSARLSQEISLEELERQTKIKKEFIDSIEREKWQRLPEFSVVSGFVKNIATSLSVEREKAMALLRRDYPKEGQQVAQPKPDMEKRTIIGPRIVFIIAASLLMFIVGGYIFAQYRSFNKAPSLVVIEPRDGQEVSLSDDFLAVSGQTDPTATIIVNNQSVLVEDDGEFTTELEIGTNLNVVNVTATSRSGKKSNEQIEVKVIN